MTSRPALDCIRVELDDLIKRAQASGCEQMAYFLACARISADQEIRRIDDVEDGKDGQEPPEISGH